MSDTNREQEYSIEEAFKEFLKSKRISISKNIFSKHIELSRKTFFLFSIILVTSSFLLVFQLILELRILTFSGIGYNPLFLYSLFGIIIGGFCSVFIIDNIMYPLKIIKFNLIIVCILSSVEMALYFGGLYEIALILILVNSFILALTTFLYFKLFLIRTSILERGRMWALIYLTMTGLAGLFIFISLLNMAFILLPLGFFLYAIYHIDKEERKELKDQPAPVRGKQSYKVSPEFLKYCLLFATLSFIASFNTSHDEAMESLLLSFMDIPIIITLIGVVLACIVAFFLGIVFDYFGRIWVIIILISTIAASQYMKYFPNFDRYYAIPLVFALYIGILMSVHLLIGDTITHNDYGKALAFSYLWLALGLMAGVFLRAYIFSVIPNKTYANELIGTNTLMGCIVCLIILINMKETLPGKEQNWRRFLVHIYIIHDSGVLLFDHNYLPEDEASEEDESFIELISGGIVGVKIILKEILRGQKHVRVIDHGDRKLLIRTAGNKRVIFALVVKEELIIFRRKIEKLMELFDSYYKDQNFNFDSTGVDLSKFEAIPEFVYNVFGK